jgi:hypothetical protein
VIVLCDIDGTAANINHRRYHVEDKSKGVDWKAFFDAMVDDAPNTWCQKLLFALNRMGHRIVFVSGRSEDYRHETEVWLKRYYGDCFEEGGLELYMRPTGNYDQDFIVKEQIYDKKLVHAHGHVLFVVDDRQQVVGMWRRKGLVVLQCDDGDF